MNEHRLTDRMVTYWNVIKKEDDLPNFVKFNPSAVADIWQQCILLAVQPAAAGTLPRVNFQRIGDNLVNLYDQNMVGQSFNPSRNTFQGASIMNKMPLLLSNPTPLVDLGQFVSPRGKVVKYRSCLLPFGRQGVVTHVVAGLSWREF